jgi:hypothetical protein
MNREELTALGEAIVTILAWPPAVLDQVARWLAPEAVPNVGHKPNGVDRHPPPTASTAIKQSGSPESFPPPGKGPKLEHFPASPRAAKARPGPASNAKTA